MQKISDFFAVEAYYDEDRKLFYFYWNEGGEKYIYDCNNSKLIEGDEDNFTWKTIIIDWYEDHKEEVDEMVRTGDVHYIEDIIKPLN